MVQLDPAHIARFREDLAQLMPEGGPLGLAVSGGPDSLALLLLAHAAQLPIAAATVDHQLRPEARKEADFVAQLCTELSIAHEILTLDASPKGNVSAWARTARYAALADWKARHGLNAIATAHHADDQLETLLMRMNRGSGVSGLAGIRARQGSILRPLLSWRKADLEALVAAAGISAVTDPSNFDPRYDRARLRQALREADWLDVQGAVRSARALQSADDALDWVCTTALNARISANTKGALTLNAADIPFELQRRMLWRCLKAVQPDAAPREDEVLRLIPRLLAGETATLGGVKCVGGALWTFSAAAPPRGLARNS